MPAGRETAAQRWREALGALAIPPAILAAAPESPWDFSPELFARRADVQPGAVTPSRRRAAEALPNRGTVLDVGCGAGAASLPLAEHAGEVVGVDPSAQMLQAFATRMAAAGVSHACHEGTWAEVQERVPPADVVVCHHVAYNVPDLDDFVLALASHARTRVVLELTAEHPLAWLNDLWLAFHGLVRPTRPTADDAAAVIVEAGFRPQREDWDTGAAGGWASFPDADELVAWVRRRLCLPAQRDAEIRAALGDRIVVRTGGVGPPNRRLATIWWDAAASVRRSAGR